MFSAMIIVFAVGCGEATAGDFKNETTSKGLLSLEVDGWTGELVPTSDLDDWGPCVEGDDEIAQRIRGNAPNTDPIMMLRRQYRLDSGNPPTVEELDHFAAEFAAFAASQHYELQWELAHWPEFPIVVLLNGSRDPEDSAQIDLTTDSVTLADYELAKCTL